MFTSAFSRLFTLCSVLALAAFAAAAPQSIQSRAQIPPGPKFVVYSALFVGPDVLPPLASIQGFNVM